MIRLVNLICPLIQVTGFMIFMIKRKKSLQKFQLFGWTLIKPFGKEWSLKPLSVICQKMPNIWNWYGLIQKSKIGFLLIFSKEYKHKNIPISTQRYKDEEFMEKSVLNITYSFRNMKQGMTTTYVRDIDINFVVQLHGLNIDTHILIQNYLWAKMIIFLRNNWMISIIG